MDAPDLDQEIDSLYGQVDWSAARGIVHVCSIADHHGAVLAIGPGAPKSSTDRFALGLARARADVILTSGAILRAEASLVHRSADDDPRERAFERWRRRVLGRKSPPSLIVVSPSADLPVDHPALHAAARGLVWTTPKGRSRLGPVADHVSVEAGIPSEMGPDGISDSLARVLDRARALFAAETILIEAGPTLAQAFYDSNGDASLRLDELLLSRFEGDVRDDMIGGAFASNSTLAKTLGAAVSRKRVEEPDGAWCFERYRATTEH